MFFRVVRFFTCSSFCRYHSFFVVSLVFFRVVSFLWCHSFFRAVWWFSEFLVFPCCPSSSCTDTLCKASRDPDTLCTASLVARHDTCDLQVANSIGAFTWKSTQCVVLFVFPACTPFSSRSTRHVRLTTSVLACQWRSTRCSAFVVCVVSIARLGRMVQHGVFSVVTGL